MIVSTSATMLSVHPELTETSDRAQTSRLISEAMLRMLWPENISKHEAGAPSCCFTLMILIYRCVFNHMLIYIHTQHTYARARASTHTRNHSQYPQVRVREGGLSFFFFFLFFMSACPPGKAEKKRKREKTGWSNLVQNQAVLKLLRLPSFVCDRNSASRTLMGCVCVCVGGGVHTFFPQLCVG